MTAHEKLRLQGSSEKAGTKVVIDPRRLPLTKLALYILSLPIKTRQQKREELDQSLQTRVTTVLKRSPIKFGRVCACLLYTSPSPRDLSTSRMPSSA